MKYFMLFPFTLFLVVFGIYAMEKFGAYTGILISIAVLFLFFICYLIYDHFSFKYLES